MGVSPLTDLHAGVPSLEGVPKFIIGHERVGKTKWAPRLPLVRMLGLVAVQGVD